MQEPIRPLSARITMALATLLGGGSLLLFGVFLFFGALGWIDLRLTRGQLLAFDAALCLAFCAQHSVMVRQGIRQRIERIVPAHYYGAVFTVTSGVALLILTILWQESPLSVASAEGAARWVVRAMSLAAIAGLLWGARSIPRFDAFGVAPIKHRLRGTKPRQFPFAVRGPYRWVRHPQYLFTLVLIWSYPDLTADRLLLDVILTSWIVVGTILEEKDLVREFGEDYVAYQRHVPMLVPWRPPWTRP